jgi:SAM-dependent methyltransferase
MGTGEKEEVRKSVREAYGKVARGERTTPGSTAAASCCGVTGAADQSSSTESCCGEPEFSQEQLSTYMGYSKEDLKSVPEGANLGLGCGNPVALASLGPGETVVDLGSGAGLDCFLAAKEVGETGHVIGVDMTPDMISKARENAEKVGISNVEFRLGEIEHIPVADNSADIIMSNCVINLSPDKPKVFRDAFRVLKPGGRLAISDIVASAELPEEIQKNLALVAACVGGAATIDETVDMLEEAGFEDIAIKPKDESRKLITQWFPGKNVGDYIVSAYIEAVKPS